MTRRHFFRVLSTGAFTLWLAARTGVQRVLAAGDPSPWARFDPESTIAPGYEEWDRLLARYVTEGADGLNRFQYGAVSQADRQSLQAYIAALEAADVPAMNRVEQFAYWANLYNAVTVELILEHYPVASIRKIKPSFFSTGPWDMKLITVMGEVISLNTIEHDILRALWDEPRVHYALNCASIGCPNLRTKAFRGEDLDEALEEAARSYVNHPRGARVEKGKLTVSSIYAWFAQDFGGDDEAVIAHLMRYADDDLREALGGVRKISDNNYDWALNDAQPASD